MPDDTTSHRRVYSQVEDLNAAANELQNSIDEGIEEVSSLNHPAHIAREQGDDKATKLLERARQFGRAAV